MDVYCGDLRVIVPPQYRESVLHLLHDGYPGMSRMKSLARLHVWWPSIDDDIESFVKACNNCAETVNEFLYINGTLHPADYLRQWSTVHCREIQAVSLVTGNSAHDHHSISP